MEESQGPQEDQADWSEGFEHLDVVYVNDNLSGTTRWVMAGYRKWNRVYVRTAKGQDRSGVVMLLIKKAAVRGQHAWTAVDPTGRVQVIDLRDKAMISSRPSLVGTTQILQGFLQRNRPRPKMRPIDSSRGSKEHV